MQDELQPTLLIRRLAAGEAAGFGWLDAVVWPEAGGRAFRLLGRAGRVLPPGASPLITDQRAVSGALMISGRDAVAEGAVRLELTGGPVDVPLSLAEPALFAGRNVILAFRSVESPATLIAWLAYHARHHGLTGALIFNRAGDAGAFAGDLAAALAAARALNGFDLRVVLVECPVPLGKADLGPESHPYLAPDAPGKVRMAVPEADPWLSPLGEPLIFELAKARFLSQARAVLTLDCSDLLADPDSLPSAFDRTVAAADGVILLAGRRTYPWRVRPGGEARFGDHVCRQFDARRGVARWGVAPEKAGLDKTWRAVRVAYARPDPGQVVPFWRAMAIRVPGQRPSVLAPKSSLIADPALVRLAETCFAARPVLPPPSAPPADTPPDPDRARTIIVTTMKNEAPFILEWLAYHRAIGVSDFLIYTNDCSDGTDRMLDLLQARGLVRHLPNPYRTMPGLKPQHAALQAAETEAVLKAADWIICMDVDEFIDIKLGDGRLPALFRAMGPANMIALTWRMFGNADVARYEDRFILEQFPLAAEEMVRKPHQAWGFKTLFRNIDIYRKLGVHRPKGLKPDLWSEVRWLNGSGRPMPREVLRNGWRSSTASFGYDWVQLNHYACRSAESFLVKRERGRVNHVDRDQGLNYWFRMNHNSVEERSIQTRLPLLRAEWARLMADGAIAAAHADAVAAHRARVAELQSRPDHQALFAEITGERMRALSRVLRHFGAAVFNAGPGVIPEGLHRLPLPEGFFFSVDHAGEAEH